MWGGFTHTAFLGRVEWKTFRLVCSLPLTKFNLLNCDAMLLVFPSSIRIFMLTVLLSLLTVCFHYSCNLAALVFLFKLAPIYFVQIPCTRVNWCLNSFIPCTGKLWKSLFMPLFPSSYDSDAFKRGVSAHFLNASLSHFDSD